MSFAVMEKLKKDVQAAIPSRSLLPQRHAAKQSESAATVMESHFGHDFSRMSIFPKQGFIGRGFLVDEETVVPEPEADQIGLGQEQTGPAPGAGPAPEAIPAPEEAPSESPETPTTDEAPSPAAACSITSKTAVHAPDGTSDTRTTIGVCETVEFTVGGQVVDWATDAGWPSARKGQSTFRWAAPEQPRTSTITATMPGTGETCTLDMDVTAPTNIKFRKINDLPYAAGSAGAGMRLEVGVRPRNVNFGWISLKEDPGPASGVTGYFATRQTAGANLSHAPNPNFVRFRWNNTICCDTAATAPGRLPPPWAAGRWLWNIPNLYRCFNSTNAGHVFTNTVQLFSINAAGQVTVTKDGQSVTRSP